jgi:uncharacterized damage-inducible protein DinB
MTVQNFLAQATRKSVADLEAVYKALPEDQRNLSPGGSARTAADMIAECAIMNGMTVELIKTKQFPVSFDWAAYGQRRDALIQNESEMWTLLHENTASFISALEEVPAEDLDIEVAMPWGKMTIAQILAYPYWNMSYHEGQINYIASLPVA